MASKWLLKRGGTPRVAAGVDVSPPLLLRYDQLLESVERERECGAGASNAGVTIDKLARRQDPPDVVRPSKKFLLVRVARLVTLTWSL